MEPTVGGAWGREHSQRWQQQNQQQQQQQQQRQARVAAPAAALGCHEHSAGGSSKNYHASRASSTACFNSHD
jgi:transcription initiation factor TFIID subunit TAF12